MFDRSQTDRVPLDLPSISNPRRMGDRPLSTNSGDGLGRARDLPDHLIMLSSSGRSVRLFTAPEGLGWAAAQGSASEEEMRLVNGFDVVPAEKAPESPNI